MNADSSPARRGIFVAPFEELAEPALVAELAARAEARGWDGFFIWDHVAYRKPVQAVADPWVTLAAVAVATERVTIGALVTPVPRRRPHQLARETVTLDRLSGGRLVFAVGIGSDRTGEFDPARFGEEGDARARAVLLDEGLERLRGYWEGEFEPRPVNGSIPVWVAAAGPTGARWPGRRAGTACFPSTSRDRRRWPSWPRRSRPCASPAPTTSSSPTRRAPTPPRGSRPVPPGV